MASVALTQGDAQVGRSSECGEWAVHRERLDVAKRECGECQYGSLPFAPGVLTDPFECCVRECGASVAVMSFHFSSFSLAGNMHSGASVGRQVEIFIHDNAQEWTHTRPSVDPQPGSLQLWLVSGLLRCSDHLVVFSLLPMT